MPPAASSMEHTVVIAAAHFCAAVIIRDEYVVDSAPILAYMRGWPESRVLSYAAYKGWAAYRLTEEPVRWTMTAS